MADDSQNSSGGARTDDTVTSWRSRLRRLSASELKEILAGHKEWGTSGGEQGQQADLSHVDLSEADLRQADLRDAILTKSSLRRANLERADLRRSDLSGADLRDATLSGAELYRCVMKYCDLRGSDLHGANLARADLEGALLRSADLTGANLTDADLRDVNLAYAKGLATARLGGADLTDASGLLGNEFAGADLTGVRLPGEIADFNALNHVATISQHARNMFLALLAACTFCWLTIATTTDLALVMNSVSSPLPVIQTSVPIAGFYWAAPLILMALFFYLHLYLQRMWEGLASLPAVFPDGRSLDQRAYPWLLSGLVRAYVPLLSANQLSLSWLQTVVSLFAGWFLVPGTIFLFWMRYLPSHDPWGLALLCVILFLTTLAAIGFYRRAKLTLSGADPREAARRPWLETVAASAVLIAVLAVSGAAVIGGGPTLGPLLGAKLRDAELSRPPPSWTGDPLTVLRELDQVLGADLESANLSYADLTGAFLAAANLSSADLRGAKMREADLRLIKLDGARLMGADIVEGFLMNGSLKDASLDGAILLGLELHDVKARNASIQSARLRGATIKYSDFDYARFQNADLGLAVLHGSSFRSAHFNGTDLTGADLAESDLTGAKFGCKDPSDAGSCTNLSGADLSGAKGLKQAQLDGACGSPATKLPNAVPAFTLRPCPNKPEDR